MVMFSLSTSISHKDPGHQPGAVAAEALPVASSITASVGLFWAMPG